MVGHMNAGEPGAGSYKGAVDRPRDQLAKTGRKMDRGREPDTSAAKRLMRRTDFRGACGTSK